MNFVCTPERNAARQPLNKNQTMETETIPSNLTSMRFDIRIHIKQDESINNVLNLQKQISTIINELRKSDDTIKVMPWSDSSNKNHLEESDIRTQMELNQFFPQIRSISQGPTWGEVKIQHSKSWETILYETNQWLNENSHGLYHKDLQTETSYSIGWLLWSFRNIDTQVLAAEIEKKH
jgi:hypothetical protein